jgi:uncharacterized membrane protein
MTTRKIAFAAVVAALYAALTLLLAPISFGASGAWQCRVSEALCILPFFFPFSAWGLFVGCIIANLISLFGVPDIVFGSLATLAAGFCTAYIGRKSRGGTPSKVLACLPPVIFNAVVVGAVIAYEAVQMPASDAPFWPTYGLFAAQVGVGEIGALYVIGLPLLILLPKTRVIRSLTEIYEQK